MYVYVCAYAVPWFTTCQARTLIFAHGRFWKYEVHDERWGAGVETQKNCTGRDWGMGSSTIEWGLRPVVKYHLRRGVGLVKFLKMVLDPRPPPLSTTMRSTNTYIYDLCYT